MASVKCMLGTVVLFAFYAWTEAVALRNSTDEQQVTIYDGLELDKDLVERLLKATVPRCYSSGNLSPSDVYGIYKRFSSGLNPESGFHAFLKSCLSWNGDTATGDGDSGAFRRVRRNADPCVKANCKWPRSSDGIVYVPYKIDREYSLKSQRLIRSSMKTFSQSTCVRFILRTTEPDYLNIRPLNGCSSYIGRQRGVQTLKLEYPNCLRTRTIQHELLHALGFHHEQSRSDRDQHIEVLWDNIEESEKLSDFKNFKKRNTDNLGTRYDFNSVMQYSGFAGSKNGKQTLKGFHNSVQIGRATKMSQTDIDRVNRLYCTDPEPTDHT